MAIGDRARPRVASLEPRDIAASGVAADDVRRARATLAVYERANTLNLLAVNALLHGAPGAEGTDTRPALPGIRSDEILPLADPASLDSPTRALLTEMSIAAAGAGDETLIPSLYRHLASSPALLRLIWVYIDSALSASRLGPAATVVQEHATTVAERLPCPVDPLSDPDVRAVLERFAPTMATMLVAGQVIDEALYGTG